MLKLTPVEWWEEFYQDPDFLLAVNFPSARETEEEVLFLDGILRSRGARRVLDLGCGYGRHSVPLARLSYWVVGLDYSALYLEEAREYAQELAGKVHFLRADMRHPPFAPASFDAALSMLTSFGFFSSPAEDRMVLGSIHGMLAEGGTFILDVANRDFLARYFVNGEHHWVIPHGKGGYLENHYRLDDGLSQVRLRSLLVRKGEVIRESGFRIRLYSLQELIGMFRSSGFDITGLWGDYGSGVYQPSSRRVILAGEKPPGG
jgi:SAM-dependent methyltransferase